MRYLTTNDIDRVAAAYGLDAKFLRLDAEQADTLHSQVAKDCFGKPRGVYWGTDAFGRYNALALLHGYASQQACERNCDSMASADFESASY